MKEPQIIGLAGILCFISGCSLSERQPDVEADFTLEIITLMRFHDVEAAKTPVTNLNQLFLFVKNGYPHKTHQDLLRFGKHAGFTNSLAEKYTFFWPHFTHPWVEGKVICMSAQPFPWGKELRRIYIARSGSNYVYRSMSEARVQAVFREAKPTIVPLGVIEPQPKPPPEVAERLQTTPRRRFDKFVRDVAGALGQDSTSGVRMLLLIGLAGLSLSTFIFLVIWFGHRDRR